MDWTGKNVLLTDVMENVGYHLMMELKERGADTIPLTNLYEKNFPHQQMDLIIDNQVRLDPELREECKPRWETLLDTIVTPAVRNYQSLLPHLAQGGTYLILNDMDGLNLPEERSDYATACHMRGVYATRLAKNAPHPVKIAYLPPKSALELYQQERLADRPLLTPEFIATQLERFLRGRETELVWSGGPRWEFSPVTLTPSTGFRDAMLDDNKFISRLF